MPIVDLSLEQLQYMREHQLKAYLRQAVLYRAEGLLERTVLDDM